STQYEKPAHPTARATPADDSLADFLDTYPVKWDGFVQLRLYLSAPGEPPYTQRYAAADVHVAHGAWELVGGHTLPCDAGGAVASLEDRVQLPSTTAPSGEVASAAGNTSDSTTTTSAGAAVTASSGDDSKAK